MKIISSKPKGQRMFKSVNFKHNNKKTKRPLFIDSVNENWWFSTKDKQWHGSGDICFYEGHMTSSYYSLKPWGCHEVYSLKAAKRLISKWNVPKGFAFRVELPYIGYEFIIRK